MADRGRKSDGRKSEGGKSDGKKWWESSPAWITAIGTIVLALVAILTYRAQFHPSQRSTDPSASPQQSVTPSPRTAPPSFRPTDFASSASTPISNGKTATKGTQLGPTFSITVQNGCDVPLLARVANPSADCNGPSESSGAGTVGYVQYTEGEEGGGPDGTLETAFFDAIARVHSRGCERHARVAWCLNL